MVGALLGAWASHRFSDSRDRRKELNEITEKIFIALTKEKANPAAMWNISEIDFAILRRRLPFWRRRSLDKYVKYYYGSKENNRHKNPNGSVSYHDTTSIVSAIDELLKFTDRR